MKRPRRGISTGLLVALVALVLYALWDGSEGRPGTGLEPALDNRSKEDGEGLAGLPLAPGPENSVDTESRQSVGAPEVAVEEETQASEPDPLSQLAFGVTGMVRPSPQAKLEGPRSVFSNREVIRSAEAYRDPNLTGTVRAIDPRGGGVADSLSDDGDFQLYGLGPGWWVIEVDAGRDGHASTRVLLSEEVPEVQLELELQLPPRFVADISLLSDMEGRRRAGGTVYLAAHGKNHNGPRTKWKELDLLTSGRTLLRWNRQVQSLDGTIRLDLPHDGPMHLSLFLEDRWIAGARRTPGQQHMRWTLPAEDWTAAPGRLEVQVLDAATGEPLDAPVETPYWESKKATTSQVGLTIFPEVPPGWRTLLVSGVLHEARLIEVHVAGGETVRKTIRLQRGVRIAGTVSRSDGQGGQVHLGLWQVDPETGQVQKAPTLTSWTSHQGEFLFPGLTPGAYLIRDLRPDAQGPLVEADLPTLGTPWVRVEATTDQLGLSIELQPLAHLVLELAEEPQGFVPWKVVDANGGLLGQGYLKGVAPVRLSLPVGTYRLETTEAGGVTRTRVLQIVDGDNPVVI